MTRKIQLLLVVCFAYASSTLLALGLGEIKLKSGLNQPLDAEITLLSVRSESNDQLRSELGSNDDFERTGIERVYFLTKIRFQTITKPNGQLVVKLTTAEPVKEPFLNFLVNLEWPNGKLLREYTLLLDPPVFDDAPRTTIAPVVREAQPTPAPRKTVTRPVKAKPQWQGETYGPTSKNDTLWGIAVKVRPNRSVSIQQAMLTLFEANPKAFMKGNINNLKRDAELKVPAADVFTELSQREAIRMIAIHNENWRTGKTTQPRVVMDTSNDSSYESKTNSTYVDQGRLSLSTNTDETGSGGASASDAIVEEENEILKQQNDSLKVQSVTDAEKIQQLERLLELKNEQLANIQNRDDTITEQTLPSDSKNNAKEALTNDAEANSTPKPALTDVTPVGVADDTANQSIVDKISSGDYNLYLGIAGAVVLLLLLGSIFRRRNDDVDYNTAVSTNKQAKSPRIVEEYPKSADDVLAGTDVNDTDDILAEENIEDTAVSDPLGEADIYLAYGKFTQAESLLLAAIAEDPERLELSTKLLECYAEMSDADKFESHVNSLETAMASDTELAKDIEDLYQTAWPEGNLFTVESEEDFSMELTDDELADTDSFDNSDESLGEDTDIDDLADDVVSEEMDDVPSVEDVFGEDSEEEETESEEAEFEEPIEEGTDDEASSDDVDTQLDLARAYIEMGDYEGTREIINEILESGSKEQCEEAQKILDSMEE